MTIKPAPAARCHACGAPMGRAAAYCGSCGAATRAHIRASVASHRQRRLDHRRAAAALAVACVGTFASLLLGATLDLSWDRWAGMLTGEGCFLAVALATALLAGRGDLRPSLGSLPRPSWLLAAVPLALASYAIAWGYVRLLTSGDAPPPDEPAAPMIVAIVVFAPLFEEWLCRGAAWHAARQIAGPGTAVVVTAVLFAFLHGLGGAYLLELPHRFTMGLLLGWLRLRSGSLWPCIAAHALHNGLAVAL